MDSENPHIQDGLLLIRSGKIEFIGTRGDIKNYKAAKTIYAKGKYLLPPFFNQHTHLSLSLYRGLGTDLHLHDWLEKAIWPLEKKFSTPDNVYLGSLLSLVEMIKNGIGTLADMDFHSKYVGKAVDEAGVRAFLGEGLFDDPTPSQNTPDETFAYTAELIQTYSGNELISIYLTPHAPFSCSPELYERSGEIARKFGIPVCSHICETKQEVDTIRSKYGMSPVELLDRTGVFDDHFIAVHGVHLSEKDIDIFGRKGVSVIHNPHSNMVLGSGLCPVPELLSKGVEVGIGTDSAASNNHLSMLREMQSAYRIHKGVNHDPTILPAAKVLEMGTKTGHDIYRMNLSGQFKKGYLADFQIIDLDSIHNQPVIEPENSILNSMANHDIITLVVNGKIIMEDREIKTLDEKLILSEARKFGKKVMHSFPGLFSDVMGGNSNA